MRTGVRGKSGWSRPAWIQPAPPLRRSRIPWGQRCEPCMPRLSRKPRWTEGRGHYLGRRSHRAQHESQAPDDPANLAHLRQGTHPSGSGISLFPWVYACPRPASGPVADVPPQGARAGAQLLIAAYTLGPRISPRPPRRRSMDYSRLLPILSDSTYTPPRPPVFQPAPRISVTNPVMPAAPRTRCSWVPDQSTCEPDEKPEQLPPQRLTSGIGSASLPVETRGADEYRRAPKRR